MYASAAQKGGICQPFLHANAAQCSLPWQPLPCAFMQQLEESIVKKTTTCRSGIFLKHYSKRTTEYVYLMVKL